MRPALIALAFVLSLFLPGSASADTFQYTLSWQDNNFPAFSYYNGTYTFTLPNGITSPTIVYGPSYTPPMNGPFDYVYAPDLTTPPTVDLRTIELDPSTFGPAYMVYLTNSQDSRVSFYLFQKTGSPNVFWNIAAGQAPYNVSLTINDLGPSPVPEPSTLILLGSGVATCALRLKRMRKV